MRWSPGRMAGAVAAMLGAGLVVAIVVTTPWRSLPVEAPEVPADPTRDFTPAEISHAAAFDHAISPPAYAGVAISLVVVFGLGLTPLGARLLAAICRGPWVVRVLLGAVALVLLIRVSAAPLRVWAEIVLRRYGLSTQTWLSWIVDEIKIFGIRAVLLALVGVAVCGLARLLPRMWWIPAAAGAFVLGMALSFSYPLLVEPVFNKFRTMPAGDLRTGLLALADRDGVPVRDVLIADASKRTTTLNAYVSGFGATRRIVVYDTLLAKAEPAQIKLIVAHELGHVKRGDVLRGTLVGALAAAIAVCLLYLLVSSPRLRHRAGLGAATVADPRSLAFVVALLVALTWLSRPVENMVSRRVEARADVHSLRLTGDVTTFVRMQRALATRNLAELSPGALEYLLFASHPTAPQRIALARSWARARGLPEPPPLAGRS